MVDYRELLNKYREITKEDGLLVYIAEEVDKMSEIGEIILTSSEFNIICHYIYIWLIKYGANASLLATIIIHGLNDKNGITIPDLEHDSDNATRYIRNLLDK